jgi:hypothetical protein
MLSVEALNRPLNSDRDFGFVVRMEVSPAVGVLAEDVPAIVPAMLEAEGEGVPPCPAVLGGALALVERIECQRALESALEASRSGSVHLRRLGQQLAIIPAEAFVRLAGPLERRRLLGQRTRFHRPRRSGAVRRRRGLRRLLLRLR